MHANGHSFSEPRPIDSQLAIHYLDPAKCWAKEKWRESTGGHGRRQHIVARRQDPRRRLLTTSSLRQTVRIDTHGDSFVGSFTICPIWKERDMKELNISMSSRCHYHLLLYWDTATTSFGDTLPAHHQVSLISNSRHLWDLRRAATTVGYKSGFKFPTDSGFIILVASTTTKCD